MSAGTTARVMRIEIDGATGRRDLRSVVAELQTGSPAIAVAVDHGALQINPGTVLEADDSVIADALWRLLS